MRARTLVLLGLALVASGCRIYVHDDWPRLPPPPRDEPYPQPPPQQPRDVLRAKEIKADRVYARIIYAKEVKARDGRVGRVYTGEGGKGRKGDKGDWGGGEVNTSEVSAEIIYAKEIKTDWIEADEIHAKEVKIGR
jgi:hypothetical protein